ncbi:hypothetical protein [Streptomyces mesophilus]|uniref:hypothetical protein n=1 Tax=Streptomyces mesophilus TaxID=1775132 RepID=UPI0033331E26
MAAISVGSVEVDVVPNTRGIRAQLQASLIPAADQVGEEMSRIIGRHISTQVAQAVRRGVTNGARTATPAAVRGGQQTGSAFARSMKTRVEAALRDLPDVELNADSTEVEREIHQIRAQLATLRDVEIGVDIDAGEAMARITQLQARLARLAASDADVDVRIDTGAAAGELAALQAQVNRLDGQTVKVDVDARTAAANMNLLTAAALTFGPALLPVLPVAAAGLGAIAAAAVAAGVGIGGIALVAVPAFKQIGTVLQAQKAAQEAATNATASGGQAAAQAASRANQLASAQAAVASAERNGARQIAQAQKAVTDARRNAGQVAAQAAQRAQQAARAVRDAEEELADAQREARRAQEDLTAARRTAARELQDLNSRLAGAQLDQRQAVFDLQDAERELRAVREKGAQAGAGELARAQLNYDRAKQQLADQTTETKRLEVETKAANKAGVEGSETVRGAQERLAEAQANVTDRTQALRDAQDEQARTAVENAQRIAEAQQRIAEAQRGVADAQVQAAEQAAAAQRQLEQAQMAGAGAVDQAAAAQAKYRAELAKLTPAARDTMAAYVGLKDVFGEWSRSLQPAVMPIFTRALNAMARALPGLTPFVLEASEAIRGLMDRASAELKTPFWRGFRDDLEKSVKPAVTGLGVAFGNVFKGMAGVVGAFLPHMDSISQRMQDVTGRFADWAAGLKGSPEFQRFLQYSSEMAPRIGEALAAIVGAAISIGSALAPISSIVLQAVTTIADGVAWLADNAPWLVQGIYGIVLAMGAWRLMMLAWRGAMLLAAAAQAAFTLVTMSGPWGWIILAVLGVIGIITLLWTKCEWFRDAVKAVWEAIQAAAVAVRDWFAGPFARFWTQTLPAVFLAGWHWIRDHVLYPIRDFFTKTIPGWCRVLRDRAVEAWGGLRSGLSGVWSGIKDRILYPIRDFFTKTIPSWGSALKDKIVGSFDAARAGIKNAWDKIKGIAKAPVQFIVDTVYNNGIRRVWNLVAGAFGAPELDKFTFASGGIMPGYTPGRDVHQFVSPTGGALELSGGEAIMRPEFTRAVGSGFVGSMNQLARSGGSSRIREALAPVLGGNPRTNVDRSLPYARGGVLPTQSFADGGIFGWIKSAGSAVAGAGSAAWNKIKQGAAWLKDTLEASARAGVENVVDPLLKRFPGMDTGFGKMLRRIPTRMIDALFGYSKEADKRGAGGVGGPRIQKALTWAKSQAGKKYQWGGNGNPSWDCSGFMSAIESVIRGQKPHRRWSTHAFKGGAPPGWKKNGKSAFTVGITHAGVGHTAGTLGKTNVESRGGDGVVVGKRAHGSNSMMFSSVYGFEPGKYDNGGMLQPGFNLAYNGTGRPEPVLTGRQFNNLATAASSSTAGGEFTGDLYLDSGEFLGVVRGEMRERDRQLIEAIGARRF